MPEAADECGQQCLCPGDRTECVFFGQDKSNLDGEVHGRVPVYMIQQEKLSDAEMMDHNRIPRRTPRVLQLISSGAGGHDANGTAFANHPTIEVKGIPPTFLLKMTVEEWARVPGVAKGGNPGAQACVNAVRQACLLPPLFAIGQAQ